MIKKLAGRRYSLAKIITSVFCAIVILFLLALVLFSSRLNNFQSVLIHITEKSFPEMESSRVIHNDAYELLYFSSHLAGSTTKVSLNVVKKKIDEKIDHIQKLIIEQDRYLNQLSQLKVIRAELDDLYQLVEQKRVSEALILKEKSKLYSLHESVFELLKITPESPKQRMLIKDWMLTYSKVITLASNALTKQRLQDVRRIILRVNDNIELLDREIDSLPYATRENARILTHQLKKLLLENSQLLIVKIEQLRVAGRVIGHDNFVKNLIDDFLRQTEYQSYQTNKTVVENTKNIAEESEGEAKLITIIFLCVLIVLFFVMAFIEAFFVKRVVALNKNVMARVNGEQTNIKIGGNDEISDVANAFNFFADIVEEQKQRLESLSLTDALTGLPNRRALDKRLKYDIDTAKRNALPLSVMLMDIDYFKKYNDAYGHIVGDSCLQKISHVLSANILRETDFVARYGGEEFLFILPDTKLDGAKQLAENIRRDIAQLAIKHEASDVSRFVTLSIGITIVKARDARDSLGILEDADHALYQAKLTGRDRYFTDHDVL